METTKQVTVENVNFRDPAERALFNKQQEALFAERKQSIIAGLKRDGLLDEKGCFVFDQPLPDDMQPDSLADFEH
jgi:hypothetical protein